MLKPKAKQNKICFKSLTDEYIRNLKREQIIENDSKNVLTIGDEKLKMVPEFVYLGHLIRYI